MRKIAGFTALLLVLQSLNLFSGTNENKSWYKYMTGTIGKHPVIMHLYKYKKSFRGYYYYNQYRQPVSFFGDSEGDSVKLGTGSNAIYESFYGVMRNNTFSGRWEKDSDSTNLDFKFVTDNSRPSMFEYEYVHGVKHLFKGWDKSPVGEYTESCIWPTDTYPNADFIRKSICSEKKYSIVSTGIRELMLKSKARFFEGYVKENKDLTKSEVEETGDGYMFSVTDEDNLVTAYYDNNIFVISRMFYSYTGGVHGNYGTAYVVFDLENSRKLALTDILSVEGITSLPGILEKNFRSQNNVDAKMTLSEYGLFVDTIPVNDNFTLTPGGMAFDYVPYEIGSYAGGEIMIYIPMEDVEKYMLPGIKKLLF